MPKHEFRDRHIFDTVNGRLALLNRRVSHLENNGTVTLPVYDLTALPPLLDNTIFIGSDGNLYVVINGAASQSFSGELDQNIVIGGSGGGGGGTTTVFDTSFIRNVKQNYNTAGNGTTDDYSKIQLAINDCISAGGGTVYLPPGDYLISAPLDFTAMRGTSVAVTLLGAGAGNIFGSPKATTRLINASGSSAIKAFGLLSGATNQPIFNLTLQRFAIQNQSGIGSNWTIDLDYILAGLVMEDIFIDGQNLSGNGVRWLNMGHGQSRLFNVTTRSFDTSTGFRICNATTANCDTPPAVGNSEVSHCSAIDCKTGWLFDGANLMDGFSFVSCKAVRSSTTVGAVTGSIGYNMNSQMKSSAFIGCHAENFETGFNINASEFNFFYACFAQHPAALVDSDTAGFRFIGTSPTGNFVTGHVQQLDWAASFEDNARTNYVAVWDRTGARVVQSSKIRDISTPQNNRWDELENTNPVSHWGNYTLEALQVRLGGTTGPRIIQGNGTPEGAVSAPKGSHFMRLDGGAGTSFYVKESGTGNTGWVAK